MPVLYCMFRYGLGLSSYVLESPLKEIETAWETVTEVTENWLQDVPLFKISEEREDEKVLYLPTPAEIEDIDIEKLSRTILSSPEFQKLVSLTRNKEDNATAALAKELYSKNAILIKQQELQSSEVERLRAQFDQLSAKFQELERKKPEPHVLVDPNSRLWRHKIQDLASRIKLLQEQQLFLNRQMSTCCKAPPPFPAIEIEKHVTKFLSGLFSSEAELEHNVPGILTWLQKLFVAKDELESRLANITVDVSAKVNKNVIKASKTSANLIMDTVAEQIKQEFVKQKNEMDLSPRNKEREESTVIGGNGLSHEQVKRIVDGALAKYDADKTGMVDYALESSGGSILSTRCTESYQAKTAMFSILGLLHWYPSGVSPRTVIQPGVHPGNCWAFAGAQGYLVIKLSGLVQLSAFSVEHIPRSLSPTGRIDSAPKDFQVFGLRDEQDEDPLEIGRFRYQENGTSLQYFKVQRTDLPPFNIVELRVESNHGNMDYTCLYRFRVHGIRITEKGSGK